MQTVTTLPILQTVSDAQDHYIGLQPNISGATNAQYVNRNISFNPASNTLSIGVNVNFLPNAVSGSAIADGGVTASKLANKSVTGTALSDNLGISSSRIFESVNVSNDPAQGTVNINVLDSAVHYFTANIASNVTLNIRGSSNTSLESILNTGQSASIAVAMQIGGTQYIINTIQIDGISQAIRWGGNTKPAYNAGIGNAFVDSYSITAIKTAPSTYLIMASNTAFGVGR